MKMFGIIQNCVYTSFTAQKYKNFKKKKNEKNFCKIYEKLL